MCRVAEDEVIIPEKLLLGVVESSHLPLELFPLIVK